MLIEVKTKVKRITPDDKIRKVTETYLLEKEFFAQAEHAVMVELTQEQESHLVDSFEVLGLKLSPIKEIYDQFTGEQSYIATLKDLFIAEDGTEKAIRYKILLWADNLTQCNQRVQELAREGYNMEIEGLKAQDIIYLTPEQNG